ncbi:hypothetical protein [Pseudoflavonifractor phocaeensis]|uniref:hypothetical protein n=1 Tax=Pseudoflavonifractor phocaeensis TaxID=1870988 RepID=UPI00195B12C0|nr:hypothetical protein [Pseudoflavonifractor phocaeensis]MBM6884320.1 hypothetical protein [Pseudoflavonifractor phocaeensis]
MKRIFCALCAMALLLGSVMTTAFAAAAPTETPQAAEGDSTVSPSPEGVTEVPIPTPDPVPLYPAEVKQSEENGVTRIEKIYYLSAQDDPSNIPTEDFEREGKTYKLLDVLKQAQIESDTQDYVEVLTLDSDTQDMEKILAMLEPELEVQTEDGYQGVLSLDHTTITVEAAGYKTSSRTVSATRTYPNLSGADVSLIPKSITDSGRTLTLADVQWQEAATTQTDGYAGHWLWPSGAVLCYQPFSECSQLPGLPTTGICGAPPDSICVGEGGHYLRTGFSDENLCGMQWHCSDRSGQYRRCRWSIHYYANGNDRCHQ